MAINLVSVLIRHERRLRLLFDNTLAAGAFGVGGGVPAFYAVTSQDNLGSTPSVVAAYVLPSNPNSVELALSADIVGGALYLVSAVGTPCTDTSVAGAGATTLIRTGAPQTRTNQDSPADDYASLLYGTDLLHNGTDYVETVDGDLATVTGLSNVQAAVRRRLLGNGLPHDPTYGPYTRQYVDGVQGALPVLRLALIKQATADDRVLSADATLVVASANSASNDPTQAWFDVSVKLLGAETIQSLSIAVPAY